MRGRLFLLLVSLYFAAGCSSPSGVDVKVKADVLRQGLSAIKVSSDFVERALSEGFACKNRPFKSGFEWAHDFPEQAKTQKPDTVLSCFWTEETKSWAITYGSITVIAYVVNESIIAYKVEDIYTGP